MKKILFTIFAIFYLSVSSGATVHLHYCMGEMVNWSLTQPQKDNCEYCGMSKQESKESACCNDDSKQVKVDQSKKATQLVYAYKPLIVISKPVFQLSFDEALISGNSKLNVYHHASPDKVRIPIFIRNCTYRI